MRPNVGGQAGGVVRGSADRVSPARSLESGGVHAPQYRDAIVRYVSRFEVSGDALAYAPLGSAALEETDVRDFLMALTAVERDVAMDRFLLSDLGKELYAWARAEVGSSTALEFDRGLSAAREIGAAAELAVLEYERRRVGERFAPAVVHVAMTRPGAPYDIRSVSVQDGVPTGRFIEVKAVSPTDWQFFWSAGEIDLAGLLGARYFLYLVPCDGRPLVEQMRVIANPASGVLQDPQIYGYARRIGGLAA